MKTKFYIDQQFGHPIWINVENGIIVDFPHEGKMEDKLNERYKGHQISSFKKEFEAIMEGSFYCIQPADYCNYQRQIQSKINKSRYWYGQLNSNSRVYTEELCRARIEQAHKERAEIEVALKKEKELLLTVHNFEVDGKPEKEEVC